MFVTMFRELLHHISAMSNVHMDSARDSIHTYRWTAAFMTPFCLIKGAIVCYTSRFRIKELASVVTIRVQFTRSGNIIKSASEVWTIAFSDRNLGSSTLHLLHTSTVDVDNQLGTTAEEGSSESDGENGNVDLTYQESTVSDEENTSPSSNDNTSDDDAEQRQCIGSGEPTN